MFLRRLPTALRLQGSGAIFFSKIYSGLYGGVGSSLPSKWSVLYTAAYRWHCE